MSENVGENGTGGVRKKKAVRNRVNESKDRRRGRGDKGDRFFYKYHLAPLQIRAEDFKRIFDDNYRVTTTSGKEYVEKLLKIQKGMIVSQQQTTVSKGKKKESSSMYLNCPKRKCQRAYKVYFDGKDCKDAFEEYLKNPREEMNPIIYHAEVTTQLNEKPCDHKKYGK
jgi:hypothetical protein